MARARVPRALRVAHPRVSEANHLADLAPPPRAGVFTPAARGALRLYARSSARAPPPADAAARALAALAACPQLLAVLGGQFSVGDEICGCVLSVRYQEDILSIWKYALRGSNPRTNHAQGDRCSLRSLLVAYYNAPRIRAVYS